MDPKTSEDCRAIIVWISKLSLRVSPHDKELNGKLKQWLFFFLFQGKQRDFSVIHSGESVVAKHRNGRWTRLGAKKVSTLLCFFVLYPSLSSPILTIVVPFRFLRCCSTLLNYCFFVDSFFIRICPIYAVSKHYQVREEISCFRFLTISFYSREIQVLKYVNSTKFWSNTAISKAP